MTCGAALEQLSLARRLADYADHLGVYRVPIVSRVVSSHVGAALADTILQAGVNYKTVVQTRVARIEKLFPDAEFLSGVIAIVERDAVHEFLLWRDATKVGRFVMLVRFLAEHHIETISDLRNWLSSVDSRENLLALHGIGPKSYDYLCGLVGIDCVAIDRHIVTFASQAGVFVSDYDCLKLAVSYAADLLGVQRRDFDGWIWRTISSRTGNGTGSLPLLSKDYGNVV